MVSVSVHLSVSPFTHSFQFTLFLKFLFVLDFFLFVSNIHSLIHSIFVLCLRDVSHVGRCIVLGRAAWILIVFRSLGGPAKDLLGVSSPDKDLL